MGIALGAPGGYKGRRPVRFPAGAALFHPVPFTAPPSALPRVPRFSIVALTAAVFAADVLAPANGSVPLFYAVPLFLVARRAQASVPLGFAALCTVLAGAGPLLAPVAPAGPSVAAGRALAVAVLWLEAAILARQQRAEAANEAHRGMLESALASMPDAVFIADAAGGPVVFNDAFVRFHRFAGRGECARQLADFPAIFEVHLPDGAPAPPEQRALSRALRGESATDVEYTLRQKRTGETWIGSHNFGPIRDGTGKIVGAVVVGRDITERRKSADDLAASRANLRALLARLDQMREAERIRTSRVIHDELGQLLTALKLDTAWLERRLSAPGLPVACNELLDRAVGATELVDTAIAATQAIAADLRPVALDKLGLAGSLAQELRRLQAHSEYVCSMAVDERWQNPSPQVSGELFYICHEALTNVVRHARATAIAVSLRCESDHLVLEVADDGAGLPEHALAAAGSLGLTGMRERAIQCGATIRFSRNEPRGTRVTVRQPRAAGEAAAG